MGTRSDIIVQRADGKFARIYCHWDGYLAHNGKILDEHYRDQSKADALVGLGDLSSLDNSADKPPLGHNFEHPAKGFCVAYGRDRGETGVDARVFETLEEAWPKEGSWTEYTYVFTTVPGGSNEPDWFVGDGDLGPPSLVRLKDALADPANYAPRPDAKSPFGVMWHRDPTRGAA